MTCNLFAKKLCAALFCTTCASRYQMIHLLSTNLLSLPKKKTMTTNAPRTVVRTCECVSRS
ncbi:hypothetical protein PF005_g33326 [Phytophthora fragariae]|uniref:Uncharacterized protein n=1 Tax=Phytophthora fragariae TaxID=53985 RepID=A0A6A3UWD4_9STRA|nr:hypothetical protein PF003_g31340 [Phytophthora fragariae]KAE9156160.1 hypothetical protein PF005_g33326 [Phytophthora fragariae]